MLYYVFLVGCVIDERRYIVADFDGQLIFEDLFLGIADDCESIVSYFSGQLHRFCFPGCNVRFFDVLASVGYR